MSVTSKSKLLAKLKKKAYRDAYVEEHVKTSLPIQMIALREQREWSQTELGQRAGMRQNAISRLEDAESGTPSISTLLRLAQAFDVALLVKFVPFKKLLSEFSDLSTSALEVSSFDDELPELEQELTMPTGFYRGSYAQAIYIPPRRLYDVDVSWIPSRSIAGSAIVGRSEVGLSPVFQALLGGAGAFRVDDEMPVIDYTEESDDDLSAQLTATGTYNAMSSSVFGRAGKYAN